MSQPCPTRDDLFDSVAFKALKHEPEPRRCENCGKKYVPNLSHYLCDPCVPIVDAEREAYCRLYGMSYPAEYQERDEQQAAELERTLTK